MIKAFSPSSLRLGRECPHAWNKEYGERVRLQAHSTSPAGDGTGFHLMAADTLRNWHSGNMNVNYPSARMSVSSFFNKWVSRFREWWSEGEHLIEEDIYSEAGGYPIHCIVDYSVYDDINSIIWNYDWKTVRNVIKPEDLVNDIQIIMQTYILMRHWYKKDFNVIKSGVWLVRYNKYVTTPEDYVLTDLPRLEAAIIAEIEYLVEASKNNFPATPGEKCLWCNHRPGCPLKDKLDKSIPEAPKDNEAAKKIINQKLWHDAQVKQLKKMYEVYVQETGDEVRFNDAKVMGIKTSKKKSTDTQEVLEILGDEKFLKIMKPYIKIDTGVNSKLWDDEKAVKLLTDKKLIEESESATVSAIKKPIEKISKNKLTEDKKLLDELYNKG